MLRRTFLIGAPAAVLGACSSTERPDQPGDACAIFQQHDDWWGAVKRAERRWGAPPALVLGIIRQESGFDHNARPARGRGFLFFPGRRPSSAWGYAQAVNATWERYERESGAGVGGRDRNEFRDAADFVSWYCGVSNRELGIAFTDARSHYLAYHEGQAGYRRGSHQGNSTLGASADRVQYYRDTYQAQLDRCEGALNRWWWPF